MKTTKFSSIAIAMLMTNLCFFLTANANANANTYANDISSIFKVDGGPISVIQFMGGVTVMQQGEPVQVDVRVIRKSDNAIVYETSFSIDEIDFSTEGWQAGDYTVETDCEQYGHQEFYIRL